MTGRQHLRSVMRGRGSSGGFGAVLQSFLPNISYRDFVKTASKAPPPPPSASCDTNRQLIIRSLQGVGPEAREADISESDRQQTHIILPPSNPVGIYKVPKCHF